MAPKEVQYNTVSHKHKLYNFPLSFTEDPNPVMNSSK